MFRNLSDGTGLSGATGARADGGVGGLYSRG